MQIEKHPSTGLSEVDIAPQPKNSYTTDMLRWRLQKLTKQLWDTESYYEKSYSLFLTITYFSSVKKKDFDDFLLNFKACKKAWKKEHFSMNLSPTLIHLKF